MCKMYYMSARTCAKVYTMGGPTCRASRHTRSSLTISLHQIELEQIDTFILEMCESVKKTRLDYGCCG